MMRFKEKVPADPHPLPPHARRTHIQITYDEEDWPYLVAIFSDDIDTAKAALTIVYSAPPEVQIIIYQLFLIVKENMTMKEGTVS